MKVYYEHGAQQVKCIDVIKLLLAKTCSIALIESKYEKKLSRDLHIWRFSFSDLTRKVFKMNHLNNETEALSMLFKILEEKMRQKTSFKESV